MGVVSAVGRQEKVWRSRFLMDDLVVATLTGRGSCDELTNCH